MADYIEQYKKIPKSFPDLQEKAIGHFSRLGFPTTRNEEWRFTNINPILSNDFYLYSAQPQGSREEVLNIFPVAKDSVMVVLQNGVPAISDSLTDNLPKGITIRRFSESMNHSEIKNHFGKYADMHVDSFAALNTAFANDGIVIHISGNAVIEKPVYLINISSAEEKAVISHNRILIVAGKSSHAKINWITVSGGSASETFVNAVNEIFVDENASVEFNVLQNESSHAFQICNTYAYQCADSRFSINTISLGGSILRNKLHIKLDGLNCETHLHGIYIANGKQLIDNHTAVFHSKPHCNSNQLYKGIIGGWAHGVFNGKILVEKDAQKTNAYQSNKNILLSNNAVINAKPQLEIFADDVKCTHGATTGQMDDEALFYMRSRGINEKDAKALLNLAFANDVLSNISQDAFRQQVSLLVKAKLKTL